MSDAPKQTEQPMESPAAAIEPTVSRDELARIACWALRCDDLAVQDWSVQPLQYTVRNTVSAGIYRLRGAARADTTQGDPLAWSVVLKVVQQQDTDQSADPGHWNYWRREHLAYQSGLLERLTQERSPHSAGGGGLAVPRCWKADEQPDGRVWLWLEDVSEADGSGRWPVERYGLAAHHFGQFQGGFLTGRPLPSAPWLSRGWMRARVASFAESMRRLHDPALWDRPMVRRTCPRTLEGRLSRLWAERESFLDALERLPQTLCHLDVWRPNLMSRTGPGGEETVALDWSYVGLGAVGQDIGNLVPDSLGNFDVGVEQAREMDAAVFEGYLQGLRASGWAGDRRQARLGYAASAALGWGLGTPWWLVWPQDAERQARIERQWGRPLEDLLVQRAVLTEFVLDLADEARTLLRHGAV